MNNKLKYVYLLSAPHSGSTLFACVLGCHKDIATVGEFGSNFPYNGQCSCGLRYSECSFWLQIVKKYYELYGETLKIGQFNINLGMYTTSFGEELYYHLFPYRFIDNIRNLLMFFSKCRKKSLDIIDRSVKLAKIIVEKDNKKIFFDTTKNPLQIPFLKRHPGVDLKVIYLVRDGRAVTWSLMRTENRSLEKAVDTWLWANKYALRVCKNYLDDKDVYFLRLEDFCNDPARHLSSILKFMDVGENINILPIKESKLHIIGNKMRLSFDGKIRKHDDSWRKNLTKDQLNYFDKKAKKMNEMFGYF